MDASSTIAQLCGKPKIDLFASRLNAQLLFYASWKLDPGASFTNAFTVHDLNFCYQWAYGS